MSPRWSHQAHPSGMMGSWTDGHPDPGPSEVTPSPQATLSPSVKFHRLNPAVTLFIEGSTKKQRQLNLPSAPHKGGLTQPKGWEG